MRRGIFCEGEMQKGLATSVDLSLRASEDGSVLENRVVFLSDGIERIVEVRGRSRIRRQTVGLFQTHLDAVLLLLYGRRENILRSTLRRDPQIKRPRRTLTHPLTEPGEYNLVDIRESNENGSF